MSKFTLLASLVLLFSTCATMDKKLLTDLSIRTTPADLKVQSDWDQYMVREDLVRAYHTETRTSFSNGVATTYSVSVPNAYSLLVIDLGNGVLLDSNRNLAIDLPRFFGLTAAKNFVLRRKSTGLFDPGFSCEKNGDSFKLKIGNEITNYGDVKDNQLLYVSKGLLGIEDKTTLTKSPSGVVQSGKFLGFEVFQEIKQTGENEVTFPALFANDVFKLVDPSSIKLHDQFEYVKNADHIAITYNGLFGIKISYTLVRTATGIIFFTADNFGFELTRSGNRIKVIKNGTLAYDYTIESEEK